MKRYWPYVCWFHLVGFLIFLESCHGNSFWSMEHMELKSRKLPDLHFLTTNSPSFADPAIITVQQKASIPGSQTWSNCKNCIWNGSSIIFGGNSDIRKIDMSFSVWGEFFHEQKNDIIPVTHVGKSQLTLPSGSAIFEMPVLWFPIITFHVGHILIDFIEQAYWTLNEHFADDYKGVLLVVDVGNVVEIRVLQRNLDVLVNDQAVDSFGQMLRWFSAVPVMAAQSFRAQFANRHVLFKQIYIGGNNSFSFFSSGVPRHPCRFHMHDDFVWKQSRLYSQFRSFVDSQVFKSPADIPSDYRFDVLFVQRNGSRVILNVDVLQEIASSAGLTWACVDLAVLPFSEQLLHLQSSRALIMAAGTAAHNMLFVRPGSLVFVAMQRDWCDWAWQYVNQGALLDITVHVHCDAADSSPNRRHHFHWTAQYWRQPPRLMKQVNVTFNAQLFRRQIFDYFDIKDFGRGRDVTRASELSSRDISWCFVEQQQPQHMSVVATRDKVMPSQFRTSIFQVFVTKPKDADNPISELQIMGEVSTVHASPATIFSQFPHFSVCMNIYTKRDESSLSCFPVDLFNFYSNVIVRSPDDVMVLHVWVQSSPDGGKFEYSDVFIALDFRVPFRAAMLLSEDESAGDPVQYQCPVVLAAEGIDSSKVVYVVPDWLYDYPSHYSWQHSLADFCHSHSFNSLQCVDAVSQIYHCMHILHSLHTEHFPPVQVMPTPEFPFVFLHVEKVGGTSLRSLISRSAETLGLDYFIPSFNGIHKCTFDIPAQNTSNHALLNVSVVAGHFQWGVWNGLPGTKRIGCFIMGRDPVDRVVSYYYQRCYSESLCPFYQTRFNDLTPNELRHLIVHFRQALLQADNKTVAVVDEGMEDAACRTMIGKRETTGRLSDEVSLPFPLDMIDTEVALANCEKCVVGLLEDWGNTLRVINFWFPWIDLTDKNVALNRFARNKEDHPSFIRDDLRSIILELNQCDVQLYAKTTQLFQKQLQILNDISYRLPL